MGEVMTAATSEPAYSAIVRAHIDRGVGIPRELYLSEELFAHELTGIFGRSWLYAGHASELAQPGQYLTVECGEESLIVARGREGRLAAFSNVCRHRGARLVDPGCGIAKRFTCPYHQWSYRLDGTLQGAPRMPESFDPALHPLPTAHVEVWQGLVFVNLDEGAAEPLADLLGAGEELMSVFDIAHTKVAHTITYQVEANWKLVWENAQECYHCNANHPELIKTFDVGALSAAGRLDTDDAPNRDRRVACGRFPLRPGVDSLTLDGRYASGKSLGGFAEGAAPYTASVHLKPSFALVGCPDYAVVLSERPIRADRTEVRMDWLVHNDAVAGEDYDLDILIKVWNETNLQDWALCERAQRGVRSRSYTPGPLALDELAVLDFYHAYAGLLEAAGF
jgi:Rieske 2Fe-2S family protein